jgi:predicted ATPase
MLRQEPWQAWIETHGGLPDIRAYLRSSPLLSQQQQLLELILAHPEASANFYATRLSVSKSTYFARLSDLMETLIHVLNTWQVETGQAQGRTAIVNNLPAALTPLIGAEETVAAVTALVRQPGVRLLTLIGPGGVGKTRLGIATATNLLSDFPDGVVFVPLDTLQDPSLIPAQVARLLNLGTSGKQPLPDALKTFLRERQMLLVLDNFEQLSPGGPVIVEWLEAAAGSKVLVTSREALNLYGENLFVVPELARPDPADLPPLEQLEQWPAVRLFAQRVRARHPSFTLTEANKEAVAAICYRLDGLPLAIELAAAQVRRLFSNQTLPHVQHSLKALADPTGRRPMRQKSLWDAIDWSYQLLPDEEKAIFRRLAVFGHEWDVEAAEIVCQVPDMLRVLEELADKSLVRYAGEGEGSEARFQMLNVVREYALEQLENSGESQQARRLHADTYLRLAQQAASAVATPDQLPWVNRIRQDHENLRVALQWALDTDETETAFRLLGAVWRYWDVLNVWSEARIWMERALTQGARMKTPGRAETLWGASWLAAHQSDYSQALELAQEGLELARELGDQRLVGLLLQSVAEGLYRFGDSERAIQCVEESLDIFRKLGVREEIAWALDHLAKGLWQRGERARSRALVHESLTIFRELGHQYAIVSSLSHAARLALEEDDNAAAAELLSKSLALARMLGIKQWMSAILRDLSLLLWRQGELAQAGSMIEESLALSREIGDRTGEGWALNLLGRMALEQADPVTARQLWKKAQDIFQETSEPSAMAFNLECLEQLNQAEKRQSDDQDPEAQDAS